MPLNSDGRVILGMEYNPMFTFNAVGCGSMAGHEFRVVVEDRGILNSADAFIEARRMVDKRGYSTRNMRLILLRQD